MEYGLIDNSGECNSRLFVYFPDPLTMCCVASEIEFYLPLIELCLFKDMGVYAFEDFLDLK